MKHLALTLLTTILFTFAASATDPNVSVQAKAANLSEVVNNIDYPMESRENGVEGRVVVLVKINKTGEVVSNKVLSSPSSSLTEAVNESMKDLKFTPAKNAEGENIPTSVKIPIDFKLTID
ncbi:MAG: energy transducer TonB [Cyclobacteriaceae bacterium]